jgi:REP element-mobilizing transposase RayT
MRKARDRHVQTEIHFRTWGGARKRAGRRQVNARKSQPHRKRAHHHSENAVHVTLRVAADVTRLRTRKAYQAIRKAMQVVLDRADFRIVHISIQGNHLHLIVEAEHEIALAKGMQAFQISAARRLNAAMTKQRGRRRTGNVFVDRYHAEFIDSPRQARHCLSYVLNNWRKHGEHHASAARAWRIDPFSSAISFRGWPNVPLHWDAPENYERLPVSCPQTWLLDEGWKRGRAFDFNQVPSVAG